MRNNERVIQTIFSVIDELNEELPEEKQLEKSLDVALFGELAKLDSLGLVNLVVATEQRIEEEFCSPITLVDERAMSQNNSPLRTIGTLIDHVCLLLEESKYH